MRAARADVCSREGPDLLGPAATSSPTRSMALRPRATTSPSRLPTARSSPTTPPRARSRAPARTATRGSSLSSRPTSRRRRTFRPRASIRATGSESAFPPFAREKLCCICTSAVGLALCENGMPNVGCRALTLPSHTASTRTSRRPASSSSLRPSSPSATATRPVPLPRPRLSSVFFPILFCTSAF